MTPPEKMAQKCISTFHLGSVLLLSPLTLCPLQIRRDVTGKWPSPPVAPSPCTSEWAGVYMYGSLIDYKLGTNWPLM